MKENLEKFFSWFADLVTPLTNSPFYWGFVIIGGIVLTIALRGIQVRKIKHMAKNTFGKADGQDNDGISPFMTAMLAIGGRVGPGNVVGVTIALTAGGPGALLWFWFVSFFGIGLAYAESLLGQLFKKKDEELNIYVGGPAFYMEELDRVIPDDSKLAFFKKAKLGRKMGILYAAVSVVGFGIFIQFVHGSFVMDGAGLIISDDFNLANPGQLEWIIAIMVALILGVLLVAGMESIIKLAGYLVPVMTGAFFLVAFFILFKNINQIPSFFGDVFSSAFTGNENAVGEIASGATGATIAMAIQRGVTRGLFATESGSGTGSIAGAASEVDHPARVAYSQSFAIFFVMLIATLTGFTVYASGSWSGAGPDMGHISDTAQAGWSFGITSFGVAFGKYFIPVIIFFFAFTSMIAVAAYAISGISYFTKNSSRRTQNIANWSIKIVMVLAVLVTPIILSISENAFVFADVVLAVQLILNVIVLYMFIPTIRKVSRDFEDKTKDDWKKQVKFDPIKLGVPHSDVWTKKSAQLKTDKEVKIKK